MGVIAVAVILAAFFIPGETAESEELIVSPRRGPFEVTVTATGELKAKNSVSIYGPTGARMARIFEMKILRLVPEGTVVTKGDFVAELDKSELTGRVQDAQTSVQKAESQYTQTKLDTSLTLRKSRDELINLGYGMEEAKLKRDQAKFEPPSVQRQAEIDYEKAERALEQKRESYKTEIQQGEAKMQEVEAELSQERRQLDQLMEVASSFTIDAPENGMVIYKRDWRGQKLTTGGTVNAWDPVVATHPYLSVMNSVTYVNEVDIQKIKVGQPVKVGLDADADKELTGTVTSVANIGEQRPNSDAKVFEVEIEIAESDSTLRPSMTTSNTIVVAQVEDALSIPLECIHPSDSLSYVFVRRGGKTIRKEVRLGLFGEDEAIVEAGLTEKDRILLSAVDEPEQFRLVRLDEVDAE
ncbi:MAG: efflux RND transporter periplasmic adaptor subunit [Bacteroidetes bacterium]|nr:efflux RND transporter periplasmic adaptor subunit [Bacteroidota bacterium]